MKLYIEKRGFKENIHSFMRKCGYAPFHGSYTRLLAPSGYPRFHIYIDETETQYILNLHLDQKRPTYGKQTAHSGEYKGKVVEEEAKRINSILK